jgi:hypothetical protein
MPEHKHHSCNNSFRKITSIFITRIIGEEILLQELFFPCQSWWENWTVDCDPFIPYGRARTLVNQNLPRGLQLLPVWVRSWVLSRKNTSFGPLLPRHWVGTSLMNCTGFILSEWQRLKTKLRSLSWMNRWKLAMHFLKCTSGTILMVSCRKLVDHNTTKSVSCNFFKTWWPLFNLKRCQIVVCSWNWMFCNRFLWIIEQGSG